jgi:hypothetical protein
MPRKNMGLGYALTRYHRIGSPTDAARVEHDRPIECVICHADKTVGGLLDDIHRLWGKRYDIGAVTRLYGARDANVLVATMTRGLPHERATALGIVRELRFRPAAAAVARAVDDPSFPLVSLYARAALAAIDGRPNVAAPVDAPAARAGASAHPGAAAASSSSSSSSDEDDD